MAPEKFNPLHIILDIYLGLIIHHNLWHL